MKIRRRFLFALLASLMLHLGVISGPGWQVPSLDEPEEQPALDARLAAPAKATGQGGAAPKPVKRRLRPKPVAPRPAPAPAPVEAPKVSDGDTPTEEEPIAPTVTAPVTAEPEPAVAVSAPSEIALPRRVRIHYDVTMGENGFVIGETIQELQHDGTTYSLRSIAETTGLVGLVRPAKVVNVSEGDVVNGTLRPRQFRVERSSGKNESAQFDWGLGRVTLSGGREFALEAATQDMLSMFCQLSVMPVDAGWVSLPVVTGKKVERYDFEVLGQQKLETPRGERMTIHLRSRQTTGKESTEVWLDLADSRLPVKIRHVDRRGDMFEQIADRIEYDAELEGQR